MISPETQIVISKTHTDGLGNVMKGFISAFSIHPNTVIECNPEYMYGNYDTILNEKHIYRTPSVIHSESFYTSRLLVLASEESEQENIYNEFQYTNGCGNPNLNHIFSMTKLIDWNYDASRISSSIKSRIINTIKQIEFSKVVIDHVNEFWNKYGDTDALGISVRTWKGKHESSIDRPYTFETYCDAIQLTQAKLAIISFDNHSVENEYVDLCKSLNIKCIVLRKPIDLNDLQFILYKMMILSRCSLLIANRISTYSELVFWFSECKIKVNPVF